MSYAWTTLKMIFINCDLLEFRGIYFTDRICK